MRILDSSIEMVSAVHGLARKVARHDRHLADQMKRASSSVALNASEGIWAKAGKRRSRLEDAVNSAREALTALRIASACGYLSERDASAGTARLRASFRFCGRSRIGAERCTAEVRPVSLFIRLYPVIPVHRHYRCASGASGCLSNRRAASWRQCRSLR
jgi:four helix bundle protein